MKQVYTAKFIETEDGVMGQLIEWPEVVTEGKNLEDCRAMLRDALNEMVSAYRQIGKPIPYTPSQFEEMALEI